MEAREFIEKSIKNYFISEKEFANMVVIQYEKDFAVELRSNDKLLDYYSKFKDEDLLRKGIFRPKSRKIIKKHIKDENQKLNDAKREQELQKKKKEDANIKVYEEIKKDFKNPDVKAKTMDELTKPKDKWKRGKKLLELQSKFPHDLVLQRMVREEFKENRLFRYPEEYEIYDKEEEDKRNMAKHKMATSVQLEGMEKEKAEKLALQLEKFMYKEEQAQQLGKMVANDKKHKLKSFNAAMRREIEDYAKMAKNRMYEKQTKGQREMLAEIYTRLKNVHPEI
jgi:hypothetical protein